MEDHIRKGMLAEPIVLMERFRRDPAFEDLGGIRYLADLVDRAPPAANAADYGRVIYDLALRRDLIRIGGEISNVATTDAETDARDQIEQAEAQLYTLAENGSASTGFVNFSDALRGAIEMAAEAYDPRRRPWPGISCGLIDLDQKLGGLHPSDLLILAGRPSMGKTALATNIAFHVARHYAWEPQPDGTKKTVNGGIVAFFSLEMSADQLAMPSVGRGLGRLIRTGCARGEIDASEFGRVRDAATGNPGKPSLYIDDTGGLAIAKIGRPLRAPETPGRA